MTVRISQTETEIGTRSLAALLTPTLLAPRPDDAPPPREDTNIRPGAEWLRWGEFQHTRLQAELD